MSESYNKPGPTPRRISALPLLVFILCFLFGIWIIPWIALPISYAINRGAERAKLEAAKELFKEIESPERQIAPALLAPWVVKKVGPSVVGIKTRGTQRTIQFPFGGGEGREGTQDIFGEGSGIIVDKAGYILTNFHVVKQADAVQVQLSDGREIPQVAMVGFDPGTDLAVLKIDVPDLEPMEWGDSNATEVGELVLAVGNPFGLEHTVTQGIISAKERYNPIQDPEGPIVQVFLQTDAAINPGNSGGPLVNTRGQLVGINTAIYGPSYQGIGFAIPSVLAKKVYTRICEKTGEMKHGWLGVQLVPLSESYAKKNNVESGKGVVVGNIVSNSPAEKADLKQGDIITHLGDQEIKDRIQFTHFVILTPPQSEVKITIVRNGETIEKTLVVGTRPPQ